MKLILRLFPFLLFTILINATTIDIYKAKYNSGYRIFDFKFHDKKNLTVAVWYPTKAYSKPYNYGGKTYGSIAVDAKIDKENGPYPLLLFSHGYGGSGHSAVFFTEELAKKGWIVAALDHNDMDNAIRIHKTKLNKFSRLSLLKNAKIISQSTSKDRDKYLYRLEEFTFALNSIISSTSFGNFINKARIAVGGHSFGGFTALGLCGTIPKYYDKRIKGLLLFSTGGGGYLFDHEELNKVTIPSMLFIGEKEINQTRGKTTMLKLSEKIFYNLSPPNYFLEIKDANHFSFNNNLSPSFFAKWLSGNDKHFEVIRKYSIAFLEKYVNENNEADLILNEKDSFVTNYLKK